MHILYADESYGFPPGSNTYRYFILSGVSVYESQTFQLSEKLNSIAARFNGGAESVELHGSPMFGGEKRWRKHAKEARIAAIKDVLRTLAESHRGNRIFASVVERGADDAHAMEYAFAQIVSRFDQYLGRLTYQNKRPQRGVILFDKSVREKFIQSAAAVYRDTGHQWGKLKYQAEVPVFIDSRASRLIQLADIVAYAINRKIAHGDPQFYGIIQSRFDAHGGKIHGLHIKTLREESDD